MELSSPEAIRALLGLQPPPARNRRGTSSRPVNKDRRIRCSCGLCPQCLDNARWERIFAEKFADPNYYGRLVMHASSPLTSL